MGKTINQPEEVTSYLSQLLNGKRVIDHKSKEIPNPENTISCTACGKERYESHAFLRIEICLNRGG